MKITPIAAVVVLFLIAGCASIQGTVVPLENGQYKAISIADRKNAAYKIAANDAKVTCKQANRPGYAVLSQEVYEPEAQEFDTGNSFANAAFNAGSYLYNEKHKQVELTTVFKCGS